MLYSRLLSGGKRQNICGPADHRFAETSSSSALSHHLSQVDILSGDQGGASWPFTPSFSVLLGGFAKNMAEIKIPLVTDGREMGWLPLTTHPSSFLWNGRLLQHDLGIITHLDYLLLFAHLICKTSSYSEIQESGLRVHSFLMLFMYSISTGSKVKTVPRSGLHCPARCVLSPAGVRKNTEPLEKTGPPSIYVPDTAFLSQIGTTVYHHRTRLTSDDLASEVGDRDSAMFPTLKVKTTMDREENAGWQTSRFTASTFPLTFMS